MNIWVLRNGDDLLTGLGERVSVRKIACYNDACEHHVCDYQSEDEAIQDAESFNRESGTQWVPCPLDFSDATPEDFDEHFDD